MQNISSYIQLSRIFGFSILLFLLFFYMVIVGYNPILGLIPVVPVVYCVFFYLNPFLFARIFFFTLGFAAFLNLPFTSGGFPIHTGIMVSGFLMLMAVALVR